MKELGGDVQKRIDWLFTRYPSRQAAMLPVLYLLQQAYGSVSDDAVVHAAKILQLPPATVYGVLSFYTLFKRPGEGRHTIWVCSTLSCALAGSEKLFDYCKARLGVGKDGTTADRSITLKKQECLGACDKAVVLQVDDELLFNQTPALVEALIARLRK